MIARSQSPPVHHPTRRPFLICLVLALLTLALFFRAIYFPFITYDDRLYVAENTHVLTGLRWSNIVWAFTTWHTGNWHPLTWISLMVDAQFFGKNAAGYHSTNVLLHVANSVLLFLVLTDLTTAAVAHSASAVRSPRRHGLVPWRARTWPSAFVAALFALHPLHVESVAWVTERKDVLSALFFLLVLGAYARYAAQPTRPRYALITLLFLLGLLSKPMLVTVPFVLLLLDFWPLRRLGNGADRLRLLLEKIPLFALSAVFSIVTFFAQRSAGTTMPTNVYPPLARLENALLSYERYLGKIFWPHDFVLPYPFSKSINPIELWWAAALLIVITVVAIRMAVRRGYLLTGWLFFLGTLVPVIGFVQVGPQAMADRYLYLPAIGVFIAFSWGASDLLLKLRLPAYVVGVFAGAVLVVLSYFTSIQLGYWKESETLFRHSLAVNPREIVALRNLATGYTMQHRNHEAIAVLQALLHETPNDALAHFRFAQALQGVDETRQAADEYETALRLLSGGEDKDNVLGSALNNLAWIRATSPDDTLRNGADAVRLAERSCNLTPTPAAGQLDTLAAAHAEQGDFESAQDTALRALELAKSGSDQDLRAEINQHLELYRQHRPYHEGGK